MTPQQRAGLGLFGTIARLSPYSSAMTKAEGGGLIYYANSMNSSANAKAGKSEVNVYQKPMTVGEITKIENTPRVICSDYRNGPEMPDFEYRDGKGHLSGVLRGFKTKNGKYVMDAPKNDVNAKRVYLYSTDGKTFKALPDNTLYFPCRDQL